MTDKKPGETSADDLVNASPEGSIELTEGQLDEAVGGRVKTSDKQQKAVLDFVKG